MARTPERGISQPGEPARMPAAGRICGQERGPDGCTDPVFSRGLCRRHYKRAAKGMPLDDPGPRPGEPSGYGRYGILEEDDERLMCHECGRWYISLGIHVAMKHEMTTRQYKLAHGLTMSASLAGPQHRAHMADLASRPESLDRIARARNPIEAGRAADPDMQRRGIRIVGRNARTAPPTVR